MSSSKSSFPDETSDVEGGGQDVSQDGSLGTVRQAMPGRALHAASPLLGIAAFGVAKTANAQFPGRGANLEIAGETDVAVGQAMVDDDGGAQR